MKRVVLNTDIFGDPDDLYALLFLLDSVKIEMIITSDEHKGGRARYLEKFLGELGFDIPVFCGEDLGNKRCYFAPNLKGGIRSDYVNALQSLKNRFTFVCISPQSELAKCLDVLRDRKAEILLMGGSTSRSEHNVNCDEGAANEVVESAKNAQWVPADITVNDQIRIDRQHPLYRRISESKSVGARYLKMNTYAFFDALYPCHYLHDPLACATLFDDKVVVFEKRKFVLRDSQFFSSNRGLEVIYGVKADYSRFWKLFNERIEKWF